MHVQSCEHLQVIHFVFRLDTYNHTCIDMKYSNNSGNWLHVITCAYSYTLYSSYIASYTDSKLLPSNQTSYIADIIVVNFCGQVH